MFVDIYDQSTDVILLSYLLGRDTEEIQGIALLEKGDEIQFGDKTYTIVKRKLYLLYDGTDIKCRIIVEPCKQ